MRIIEFCGPPGCGKSTLCDLIETELKIRGYKVINLQKRKKCDTLIKKLKKAMRIIQYKTYDRNSDLKKELYSIQGDKKWADRILEANWLVDNHLEYDYILFDEGPIQWFSSLTERQRTGHERALRVLNEYYYRRNIMVFSCKVSLAENIDRLTQRNKKCDRFVMDDKANMERVLTNKIKSIESIVLQMSNTVNNYDIDTFDSEIAFRECMIIIHNSSEEKR